MPTTIDLRDVFPALQPVIDLRANPSPDGPPPVGTTPFDAPYVVTVSLRGRGRVTPDTVTLVGFSKADILRFGQTLINITSSAPPPDPALV